MESISELINQKKAIPDFANAKPMKVEEVNWVLVKKYVFDLPANYRELLSDALAKNTWFCKTRKYGKGIVSTLSKQVYGYEIMLQIIEDESRAVKKVDYFAFDNPNSIALVREVVGAKY